MIQVEADRERAMARFSALFVRECVTGAEVLGSHELTASDGIQAAIDEAVERPEVVDSGCTAIDIFECGALVERVGVGKNASRT